MMSMTIMEVVAPAANGLIELGYDDLYRDRTHGMHGEAFDFLFDPLQRFGRGFNLGKPFSRVFVSAHPYVKSKKAKGFLA